MADRVEGPALERGTIDKYRTHLRSLAHFQTTTPGYCASLRNFLLTARPARIFVEGNIHDPDCTKGRKPRTVTFRKSYSTLARRTFVHLAFEFAKLR
jgi:hypothetical protein